MRLELADVAIQFAGAVKSHAISADAAKAEVADKVAGSLGGNAGSNLGAIQGRLLSEAKQRAPADLSATTSGCSLLSNENCTPRSGT
jgi:hypothetical protein